MTKEERTFTTQRDAFVKRRGQRVIIEVQRTQGVVGTRDLYGPFPDDIAARRFIKDYALNSITSVAIRPLYDVTKCIEQHDLRRSASGEQKVRRTKESPYVNSDGQFRCRVRSDGTVQGADSRTALGDALVRANLTRVR